MSTNKILVLAVIILFIGLVILGITVFNMDKQIKTVAPADSNNTTANNSPAPQKTTKQTDLSIQDQGFSPAGIQIYANQSNSLTITNNSKQPHSFVIDELKINSGLIQPGQTKTVVIDQDFPESAAYNFYSDAASDDKTTFKGILMILK